jgi:hypothetical protein
MSKQKRIEGTFESNLWTLVLENAGLDRFRELFEIKHKSDDLLAPDPSSGTTGTVFDFCRMRADYKEVFDFLYKRLTPEQKQLVKPRPKS